ncbi:glycosyl hydrolase [Terribacillus saccharophilus]|nr:glycosyl hydrolase [Terribacillus saccharophilus]
MKTMRVLKRISKPFLIVLIAFLILSMNPGLNEAKPKQEEVKVWFSSENAPADRSWYDGPKEITYKLDQQSSLKITNEKEINGTTIFVDPDKQYQQMLGVGTSLEESSIFNLSKMAPGKRKQALRDLFDPKKGIGMDVIRITIGTSDFTAQDAFYTYNDIPITETDYDLSEFSIQRDIDLNIVSTLKEALKINPDIKIFASPWSPPAWMKTNNSLIGGRLEEKNTEVLAAYYRKFVQSYEEQGIPIYAMTMQNEPLLEIDYPSMYMPPEQQSELAVLLRGELDTHHLDTKLWTFDHNFSEARDYVSTVFEDDAANDSIAGIAFHDYAGDPKTMGEISRDYPDKSLHLTERSVWGTAGADRIAQYFRNGAASYNAWVTMLDSNISTHHWIGTPDPTMLIQNADNVNKYWKIPIYYMTGNYSKFVDRGAKRIDSNYGSRDSVTNVSFLNPDNSIVTVVTNQTDKAQKFRVVAEGKQFVATLPARTVGTYEWQHPSQQENDNLIENSSFETGTLDQWTERNNGASAHKADADEPFTGIYKLTHWHWDSYQQQSAQKVTNVPDGTYEASVWVRSGGGQNKLHFYAKDYGGAKKIADIGSSPVTSYTQYKIDDIQVTSGQVEVGVCSDANAGNWAAFDRFELKQLK